MYEVLSIVYPKRTCPSLRRNINMARQKLQKTRKENIYWYQDSDKKKKYAYRYKYYDHVGKRREKSKQGFNSDVEAERALTKIKSTILNGGEKIALNEQITVEQWMDVYLDRQQAKWKVSTAANYKRITNLYVKPLLGKIKMSKLTRGLYEKEFIEQLSKMGKSAKSIELYHGFFMGAINAAVDEEAIQRNKMSKADLPKVAKQNANELEGNYLTVQELQKLLSCVKREFSMTRYMLILLLASTGMRRGEACALRWSEIDLQNKKLSINHTRDHFGERSTKTDNSIRTIDITDFLASQFEKYKVWCKERKLTFGMKHTENDYVFISRNCNPINQNEASIVLDQVTEHYDLKRITPHGLRHTFVTILISNNVPVTSIAKIIGDTPQTVMKTYAHSFEENEKKAMKVLSEITNIN